MPGAYGLIRSIVVAAPVVLTIGIAACWAAGQIRDKQSCRDNVNTLENDALRKQITGDSLENLGDLIAKIEEHCQAAEFEKASQRLSDAAALVAKH